MENKFNFLCVQILAIELRWMLGGERGAIKEKTHINLILFVVICEHEKEN